MNNERKQMPQKFVRKRPISLDNLRGFDAAARHLSFTGAAEEMHLTQSSVSRQIAALEYEVGQPLFVRKTRALELTNAGHRLARAVRQTLDALDACVEDVRGGQSRKRVTVTTFPSFASLWLIPHLPEFSRIAPDVDLRVDSTEHVIDLAAERIDVAIRLTHEDKAPRTAVRLIEDAATPVISPALLKQAGPVKTPQDLTRFTLLSMEDRQFSTGTLNWENWFAMVGVKPPRTQARVIFNFIDQTMQAAVRGQGVALARRPFLDEFVARGELVAPFAQHIKTSKYGYYLVINPDTRDMPHVKAFCDWMKESFKVA
jgi:LysR family transcriptional regulator, glycine cleavage system transcriptional activator